MRPYVPEELLDQAEEWHELHRWERSELGKALRRLGLTYGEIREIIPVPKGTLSNWCRDVRLTDEQIEAIRNRSQSQAGVPKDSQWRRRLEISEIRATARRFALDNLADSFFVAGVVLYWAEGSKTRNDMVMANTDAAVLRLFVSWTRRYLDPAAQFVLSLHIHEGNDEAAAQDYWARQMYLTDTHFTKSYVKPRGTGHRKNRLPHGVCRIRVRRSADHWNRTMEWIDVLSDQTTPHLATLAPGR